MKNYPKHPFKLLKEMILLVSDCTKYYKLIVILGYLTMHTMNMYAQNNISGFVKDSEGEPLIGISVVVEKRRYSGRRYHNQYEWVLSNQSNT